MCRGGGGIGRGEKIKVCVLNWVAKGGGEVELQLLLIVNTNSLADTINIGLNKETQIYTIILSWEEEIQ